MIRRRNCTVLSIGIDGSTAFEVGIFSRYGCEIHGFDHTVEPRPFGRIAASGWRQAVKYADWSHPMDHFRWATMHKQGLNMPLSLPQMASKW